MSKGRTHSPCLGRLWEPGKGTTNLPLIFPAVPGSRFIASEASPPLCLGPEPGILVSMPRTKVGPKAPAHTVDRTKANLNRYPSERLMTREQLCGARTEKGFCESPSGMRTSHPGWGKCVAHGGNTTAGKKFAARQLGAALMHSYKAEHLRFGGDRYDPEIASLTPELVLLEEVRRSAAMVRFLEDRIAMWGLDSVQSATLERFMEARPGKDGTPADVKQFLEELDSEEPDSPHHLPDLIQVDESTGIASFTNKKEWLTLYREERQHMVKTAKMTIDAGVAQRIVSIAEDQGRVLASAIRAVLAALQLSSSQSAMVPHVVPPILRAIASDQPVPDITSMLNAKVGIES